MGQFFLQFLLSKSGRDHWIPVCTEMTKGVGLLSRGLLLKQIRTSFNKTPPLSKKTMVFNDLKKIIC
ncbi:hypothetical protein COY62_00680 [bacterium (Candidatus Howlettbacteria) CG_4_10_14_0_8_um_filter_40_9]|nr:MAG: hypothetical protein COY62_00680 [bacterium (Candidatus Howlettbacteria) CG_4_10_14_0_8_um_filter_40_9]